MLRFPWKKTTMFSKDHSSKHLDEIQLRNRKNILKVAAILSLLLLLYPVIKEKSYLFSIQNQARTLTKEILNARLQATKTRNPTSLTLLNPQTWQYNEFPQKHDCDGTPNPNTKKNLPFPDFQWRALLLKSNNPTGIGSDIQQLCFHPIHGITLNNQNLSSHQLFLLVSPQENTKRQNIQQIILSNSGIQIQPLQ